MTTWDGTVWQDKAKCRDFLKAGGEDLWFRPDFEREDQSEARVRQAKAICQSCPVKHECALEGMSHVRGRDPGIYGGMTGKERQAIARRLETITNFTKAMETAIAAKKGKAVA